MQAAHSDAQETGGKSDLSHFGSARTPFRFCLVFLDGVELLVNILYALDHFAAAINEAAREKQAPENEERLADDQERFQLWFDRGRRLCGEDDNKVDHDDCG